MLPARSRVRTRDDHARVGSSGRRARSGPLVVHSLWTPVDEPARAGFVVGRRVGKSVVRNQVRRRLREQVRARLDGLPAGTMVVVRALPGAGSASSADLGAALDQALARAARPDTSPGPSRTGARGRGRGGR